MSKRTANCLVCIRWFCKHIIYIFLNHFRVHICDSGSECTRRRGTRGGGAGWWWYSPWFDRLCCRWHETVCTHQLVFKFTFCLGVFKLSLILCHLTGDMKVSSPNCTLESSATPVGCALLHLRLIFTLITWIGTTDKTAQRRTSVGK